MVCKNCNSEFKDAFKYCPYCGNKISDDLYQESIKLNDFNEEQYFNDIDEIYTQKSYESIDSYTNFRKKNDSKNSKSYSKTKNEDNLYQKSKELIDINDDLNLDDTVEIYTQKSFENIDSYMDLKTNNNKDNNDEEKLMTYSDAMEIHYYKRFTIGIITFIISSFLIIILSISVAINEYKKDNIEDLNRSNNVYITKDNYNKLRKDMTKEEVYDILSEPDKIESDQFLNSSIYNQSNYTNYEDAKWYNRKGNSSINITFKNGKALYINSDNLFEEDND